MCNFINSFGIWQVCFFLYIKKKKERRNTVTFNRAIGWSAMTRSRGECAKYIWEGCARSYPDPSSFIRAHYTSLYTRYVHLTDFVRALFFFRALDSSDFQIFFTHVHLCSIYVTTYVTDIYDEKSVYGYIVPTKCKNAYRMSHRIEVMMDCV